MMKKKSCYIALALGLSGFSSAVFSNEMVNPDGSVVVGYWHNWCDVIGAQGGNAPCITLDDINPMYNVVNIAFMKVDEESESRIPTFKLDPSTGMSQEQLIEQINTINEQKRSVILSLGGDKLNLINGDETALAQEIIDLTEKYGFDGLDINLEAEAITAADNQTVIPAALKLVKDHYKEQDKNFMITMAPAISNLQEGGKYIPYLHALEGYYDWINPQFFNQGDWGFEVEGVGILKQNDDSVKKDFIYYSADSLANGTRGFHQIPHNQIVYGIPANPDAANDGFVINQQDLFDAFNQLKNEDQILRGIMTWSINWDMGNNVSGTSYDSQFINTYGPFIHGNTPPPPIDGKPIFRGVEKTRVKQGAEFDPYKDVIAWDKEDGDLTSSIVVEGSVDINTLGNYVLTYSVKDSNDNETKAPRLVHVYSLRPVIKGVADTTIQFGESFDPMEGVKAIDAEDGDLTEQIKLIGKVNTDEIGTYDLVYQVTDSANQTTTSHRMITVKSSGECAAPWNRYTTYVAGDLVYFKGETWQARWWTSGERPGTTGKWGVWTKVDDNCDPSTFSIAISGLNKEYLLADGSIELNLELSTSQPSSVAITIEDSENTSIYDNIQQIDGDSNLQIVLDNVEAGNFTFTAVATPEEGDEDTISQSFSVIEEGGYLHYDTSTTYAEGDIVIAADEELYQCKPWPYTGWCSNPAYAPGESQIWSDAWTKL